MSSTFGWLNLILRKAMFIFERVEIAILALAAFAVLGCSGQNYSGASQLSSGDDRVVWENRAAGLVGGTGSITLGSLLTLNATINPPTGQYVNDIFVKGTNAYVSYNVPGATAKGAIDQINVTTVTTPVRSATFLSNSADINGVYVDASNYVYAVGGDGINGSLLYQLSVTSTSFSSILSTVYLPSYAGTAVRTWGTKLLTLSGNTGGLNLFTTGSQATTATPTTSISDARAMDQSGTSNLWVVAGGGNLYEVSSAGAILNTVTFTGANNVPEAKSGVRVGTKVVAVSLGTKGTGLVCMSDKQVVATIAAPTVGSIDPSLTVSNAVAFGDGLLFVANGEAGVYVYAVTNPLVSNLLGGLIGNASACGNYALTYEGSIDLGSSSHYSANNVYYSAGVLYVATGAGGFKVISVNTSVLGVITGLIASL